MPDEYIAKTNANEMLIQPLTRCYPRHIVGT